MPNSPLLYGPNSKGLNLQNGFINGTNNQWINNDGPLNYAINPQIETGTTIGYSLGTVTLTSNLPTGVPTFGSGASGNLSLSATSTNPLDGTYSLSFASSAATTGGNFIATDAFTIAVKDYQQVLNFSLKYKATSGGTNANWSGTTSNSFAVAIYDVTNSAWIIPIGVFNFISNGSAGAGTCTGSFQASSSGVSYRLVVYNANATSGAITVYFDDFAVGPSSVGQNGQAMVARYTDTSGGAIGTSPAVYKYTTITNDTTASYSTSTGLLTAPISGFYWVSAGLGFQIGGANTLVLYIYKNGAAYSSNNVGNPGAGPWYVTHSDVVYLNAGETVGIYASVGSSSATGVTTAATNHLAIGLMQNAAVGPAGQVVASKLNTLSTSSLTANTAITFTTTEFDLTGSLSSANKFTCPVSGIYLMTAFIDTLNSSGAGLYVAKNGSFAQTTANKFAAVNLNGPGAGAVLVQCNAGDTLQLAATASVTSSGTSAFVDFALWQGPSAANSSNASVNARYYASATSISGSLATIVWTTKDFDTSSGMSSGVYTIPVTGKYQINSAVATTGTFALNNQVVIEIQKNSSVVSREKNYAGGIVTDLSAQIGDIISCIAGDTIRIQLSSGATSPTIVSSNFENYFSISSVGQ